MYYLNEIGLYASIIVAIYLIMGLLSGVITYFGVIEIEKRVLT